MPTVLTTLADQLQGEHTALLVWDCQNGLVDRAFDKASFVARTAALLAWARNTTPADRVLEDRAASSSVGIGLRARSA